MNLVILPLGHLYENSEMQKSCRLYRELLHVIFFASFTFLEANSQMTGKLHIFLFTTVKIIQQNDSVRSTFS